MIKMKSLFTVSKWLRPMTAHFMIQIITIPFVFAGNQNVDSSIGSPTWRPFASVAVGGAMSREVGTSKAFPIVNIISDEFYRYTSNDSQQNVTLFNAFLGGQRIFRPNWQLQLGLEYSQPSVFTAKGNLLQGADIESADQFTYQYNIRAQQLLITGKLLYQYHRRFYPYVLAGLGGSLNKAYDYATDVPPFLTFTREYANNTKTSFSYNLGLGLDVNVTNHLRVGVGYRFANFGNVELGNAAIEAMPVTGTLSQSTFYIHGLLAQLTFLI